MLDSVGGLTGVLLIIVLVFALLYIWRLFPQKSNNNSEIIAHLININQAQQEQLKGLIDKLYESQQNTQGTLLEILRTQQNMLQATTNIDPEVFELIRQLTDQQLKQLIDSIQEDQ